MGWGCVLRPTPHLSLDIRTSTPYNPPMNTIAILLTGAAVSFTIGIHARLALDRYLEGRRFARYMADEKKHADRLWN